MTNYIIFLSIFLTILSTFVTYLATKLVTIKTNLVANKTKECNILRQNCENVVADLVLNHKIDKDYLKQDFENKIKLLQNNDNDLIVSNHIYSNDIVTMTLFKSDVDFVPNYFNPPPIEKIDVRYAKDKLFISIAVSNPDIDLEQIESILCKKLATYLVENNFVKNKINIDKNLITFCLNFYNKI
jgi:hypothetical protein